MNLKEKEEIKVIINSMSDEERRSLRMYIRPLLKSIEEQAKEDSYTRACFWFVFILIPLLAICLQGCN